MVSKKRFQGLTAWGGAEGDQGSGFNVDIAAKRRKKPKNKISGLVNSMSYSE